jgi:hypothetical protein
MSILRRLPAKRLLSNDVLFHLKNGPILRSPLAASVSDKEFVKRYIAQVVGDQYNIPTLAILKSPKEIDGFDFPDRCIIKPTHASAECIARRAGEPLDLKRIKTWLKLDFYERNFEANYRGLMPKVIVEEWAFATPEMIEIKFFCVDGKVRALNAIGDRFTNFAITSYDLDWNETPYKRWFPAVYRKFEKPNHLAQMISLAERLAQQFFIIRVDLYYDGTTIKCGEITSCPYGALEVYEPREGEIILSRQLFSDIAPEKFDASFDGD